MPAFYAQAPALSSHKRNSIFLSVDKEQTCAHRPVVANCHRMIRRQTRFSRVLLCVALSVLLHVLLACLLLLLPQQEKVKRQEKPRKARAVQVLRTAARKKADAQKKQAAKAPQKPEAPAKEKPFAKTSADTPQALPDQPDYEGQRNTRAASEPDAAHRRADAPVPAQN